MNTVCEHSDLLVLSHLRWDFVFQRPQHLMTRFAVHRRVFFFEEPVTGVSKIARLHVRETDQGVTVVVPHLPSGIGALNAEVALTGLLNELVTEEDIRNFTLWYYTPMALKFSRQLRPRAIIYDSMDDLSKFRFAPEDIQEREDELLRKADLVFTGGHSLYEAKKSKHKNIHAMPSSIDHKHFARARILQTDPPDQIQIPRPRLGFFGVIDERLDVDLLAKLAEIKPDWQFVMIGPVVKIDPISLPNHHNIHYLGKKDYQELPSYLGSWDCAIMPFARNEATEFISPTKTPEFLAAGRPVVSTPIRDVVNPYAEAGLVRIAANPQEFVGAIQDAIQEQQTNTEWLNRVDQFLGGNSWDQTWHKMATLEHLALKKKASHSQKNYIGREVLQGGIL